jgi:hypothetical protein
MAVAKSWRVSRLDRSYRVEIDKGLVDNRPLSFKRRAEVATQGHFSPKGASALGSPIAPTSFAGKEFLQGHWGVKLMTGR